MSKNNFPTESNMIDLIEPPFEVESDSTKAESATAIALRKVSGTVAEFDAVEAGLQTLEGKYKGAIFDVEKPAGLAAAKVARADIREPRYAVQHAVANAKKPLMALSKAIAARGEEIIARITPLETPIHAQIEAEENRRAAEKAAQLQVLALSTGRPLALVAEPVAALVGAQWNSYPTRFSELHLRALKQILDQEEPDYAS